MKYNIWFDAASLIYLTLLIWRYYSLRLFPSLANRGFGIILWVSVANIIFDIVSCLCLEHIAELPVTPVIIVNLAYFMLQIFLPSAITLYLAALIHHTGSISSTSYKFIMIPAGLSELILLFTMPKGLVFSVTAEKGYQRGPLAALPYICCIVYFCISIYVVILFKQYFSKEIKTSFAFMIAVLCCCMAVQAAFPSLMLIGTGVTISLLIFFLTIQNPSDMVDSTTQLMNQNAFVLIMQEMLNSDGYTRLIVADLDGLRQTKAMYGVNEGNNVLRQVADYISECKKAYACRISDTRFALVLRDKKAYNEAVSHLSARTSFNWPLSGQDGTVPMELRICLFPTCEQLGSIAVLHDVIELAFQESENPVYEVDQSTRNVLSRRAQIGSTLTYALNNGRKFTMHYQPVYSLSEDRFVGAEALLRFSDSGLGNVYPDELFRVARHLGLYGAIDRAVIDSVFDDIAKGIFDGFDFTKIHINLSAASFDSDSMADFIIETQKKYGISPKMVGFEITETIAGISIEEFNRFVSILKPLGYSFALDDFGTGNSNIARLILLPFDCVKLDRRLLEFGPETYTELASFIRHINRRIIAEGIETRDQLDLVNRAEIDEIQGYFYSKPVSPDELSTTIANQRSE